MKDKTAFVYGVIYTVFCLVLFLKLLELKTYGFIACSWWVVTLPLWALPAAFIAFIAVTWIIYAVVLLVQHIKRKKAVKKLQNSLKDAPIIAIDKE